MKIEKAFTLVVLICCFVALLTFQGCATSNYFLTCWDADGKLTHHEEKKMLFHTTIMDEAFTGECKLWR